jgi:iron complex outermembrane receptor protein
MARGLIKPHVPAVSPMTTSTPKILRAALAALACFLSLAATRAATAEKSFDIPAGQALPALKQFAAQSGEQLLYSADVVQGVTTHAVKGTFTPREALEKMVSDTKLAVVADRKNGALSLVRADDPNASRAIAETSDRPATSGKAEGGPIKLEVVKVTGTRLRGLLEGATAQPTLVYSSKDIERTGAQSLGDMFRYIPQVSNFSLGHANTRQSGVFVAVPGSPSVFSPTASSINGASGRTTAALRGGPGDGTLLLVNGRRAPKNNQSAGGDGYDLNGIPLGAVDRIEVLLDGASSIYGADAIGGVINVILKKNYRGTELRLGYENTFDKDAGVFTTSLSHGFAQGRLRGLVTLSYESANSMALRDRALTASYDRRPYGGVDLRGTIIGGTGRVSRTGTVPLPGLTTTSSALPSGTNGTGLTQASYAAAGPISGPGDMAQFLNFSSEYERRNALANLSYEFNSALELYGELRAGENRNVLVQQPLQASLSIPAGYPGNPFGIAVTLNRYFFDVRPERTSWNKTLSTAIGARGKLPGDWRYDASIGYVKGNTRSEGDSGTSLSSALFNAAVAAGRTPNLFYDSTSVANPNAAGVLEALTTSTTDQEITDSWTYALQADGPVWTLPGGKVQLAAGAEYREEYTDFPRRLATDTTSARASNRDVTGAYAEVNVPVFGPAQQVRLLNQLNLSASYRHEDYSDGGTSTNPRGGLAWRPAKWLLLRGSFGEGFKVPTLVQTNAPISNSTQRFSGNTDPLRGNELQNVNFVPTISSGSGNPGLRPEKSKNTTAGLVIEVPPVKGLSFSLDYFDNKFIDRISSVTFEQRILFFPERVTRGPNLPTDQPGWAGPITGVDLRVVNVAYSRTTGYDLGVKFDRTTPWGDVFVNLVGTKYSRNEFVPAPGGAPTATINTDSLPVQVNGAAFLTRGAWSTGVLASYRASNRASTFVTATPSAIRWDWQAGYDFDKSGWFKARRDRWYGRALQGTKVSLTVFNVLNTEPPLDNLYLPDNTVLDARLRRYGISFRKAF